MKVTLGMCLLTALIVCGCDNFRAKHLGGTITVQLNSGQKLVNATWKDAQLWYLTRPMHSNEVVETYYFKEKSMSGVLEGTVIFQEVK